MPIQDLFAPISGSRRIRQARLATELGRFPFFVPFAGPPTAVIEVNGDSYINLGSNNYLGLTTHPRVMEAATDAVERYGTGVTGSRLMNGTLDLHLSLEESIAEFYGQEAAVVFPTGFAVNLGVLSAVTGRHDTIISDKEVHASLVEGARSALGKHLRFRHNDPRSLDERLNRITDGGVLVAVDGVYSMEGSTAPLVEIVSACQRAGARLLVDEAHGLGVLGLGGRGASEQLDVLADVSLFTITFSKALGSCGGAVVGPRDVLDHIKMTARAFLFTASGVPAAVAAASAALQVLREEPERCAAVRTNADYLRSGLRSVGWTPLPGEAAIISVPIGEDFETIEAWKLLWNRGVYTNVALHPAVAEGEGMLRTSVMATHTTAELDQAIDAFAAIADRIDRVEAPA